MRHIGVLESNTSGSGFTGLRVAKELGCHVTFFTSGMERFLAVPGGAEYFDKYVDEIVLCETKEFAPVIETVRQVAARRPFDAFMSLAEYEIVVAAQVATELGVPTPEPQAVAIARNKVLTRRHCAERGIPMPAFRAVQTPEQAAAATVEVGLPCVVKPADEASSVDVRRCVTIDEAVEHFGVIWGKPENVRGQSRYREILVEECALGHEVSVEVLAAGSELHVLGVTDKQVAGNNRFVEVGHLFPSLLPQHVREACEQVAVDALRAVGFDLGLAHVEVMYTGSGAKLIEINARPAGDQITELVDLSLGTRCLELVVRQYLGEQIDDKVPTAAVQGAAIRFITADAGRVASVAGREIADAMPGVREAVVSARVGDLVGPLVRNEDRVGHVLAVGETAYLAARNAEAAAHQICIVTSGSEIQ